MLNPTWQVQVGIANPEAQTDKMKKNKVPGVGRRAPKRSTCLISSLAAEVSGKSKEVRFRNDAAEVQCKDGRHGAWGKH